MSSFSLESRATLLISGFLACALLTFATPLAVHAQSTMSGHDAVIDQSDLKAYRSYLEGKSGRWQRVSDRALAERLGWHLTLESSWKAKEPGSGDLARLELLELQSLADRARLRLKIAALPDAEALEAAFAELPAKDKIKSGTCALENIFLQLSGEANPDERVALRVEAETLHRRIKAGESFNELASAHSDSSTATKGGSAGTVDFDELPAALEERLLVLPAGQITEVLAIEFGFLICRCAKTTPTKHLQLVDLRQGLTDRLIAASLGEAIAAIAAADPAEREADEQRLLSFADGESVDQELYFAYAKDTEKAIDENKLATLHQLLVLARHARREGLAESLAENLRWSRLDLIASIESDRWLAKLTEQPSAEAIAELATKLAREGASEAWQVERIEIRIDEAPQSDSLHAIELGSKLASGDIVFADLRRRIGTGAGITYREPAWLRTGQLDQLRATALIKELEPGESTGFIQDRRTLRSFHLVDHAESRPLEAGRAEQIARQRLLSSALESANAALRAELFPFRMSLR